MYYRAINLEFGKGTNIIVTFQNGKVIEYDMLSLSNKYPQLNNLKDRRLFLSAEMYGGNIIVWNEDIDIGIDTVYEDGIIIRQDEVPTSMLIASSMLERRILAGLTREELANKAGVDKTDISKIERGAANPSISTLDRIAKAMNAKINISFEPIT